MADDAPPDHVDLVRNIWDPDDVIDGRVLPTAFPSNDLRTMERRLSVDRGDALVAASILQRVVRQKEKADASKGIIREKPCGVFLNTGQLRVYDDGTGTRPFAVDEAPIIPDNPAHCLVENKSGNKGKAYIIQLQTILAKYSSAVHDLEDLLKNAP